jgi:hypothetical protein
MYGPVFSPDGNHLADAGNDCCLRLAILRLPPSLRRADIPQSTWLSRGFGVKHVCIKRMAAVFRLVTDVLQRHLPARRSVEIAPSVQDSNDGCDCTASCEVAGVPPTSNGLI